MKGQNLIIERRYAEGHMERSRAFADELVRLKVDVLFTVGNQVIQKVKDATSDIPIVMVACDALATGHLEPRPSRREPHRPDLHRAPRPPSCSSIAPSLLLRAVRFVRPYGLLGRAEVLLGRIRQPNPEQRRRKQVTHCGLT